MNPQLRNLALAGLTLAAVSAHAGLVDTVTDSNPLLLSGSDDNALGANEYGTGNGQKVLGSGSGFSGALGAGSLYLDSSLTDLKIGFQPGGDVNDNVVLYLDTKAGGFTDADMSDTADGGRTAVTNPIRDSNIVFDAGFRPDYAVVIGNFGVVSFELTSGSLNFIDFFGDVTGGNSNFREFTLSKLTYGIGTSFNFLGIYTSDTGFLSDETLPGGQISGGNAGFGTAGTTVNVTGYDRFQAVPEPASMVALGLGAAALLRRRRK